MLNEKTVPFAKNNIIVVNSNVLHHTNTSDMIEYTCLIIDTKFCEQININPHKLKFSCIIKDKYFLALFNQLVDIYVNCNDALKVAKLNEALIKILIELKEITPRAKMKLTLKIIRLKQ